MLYIIPTIQGLVEYAMYVSQDNIPMYGGDDVYQWILRHLVLTHGIINQKDYRRDRS